MNDKIVIIHETFAESVFRDFISLGSLLVGTLTGWFLGSTALEWIGGLLFLLVFFSRAITGYKNHRFSIADARAYLDTLEKKQ